MMSTATLVECLTDFRLRVNDNPRIKRLLKKWEPMILVESTDSDEAFSMLLRQEAIAEIRDGLGESDHMIHLRASGEILRGIFSGRRNPARAYVDGELEVFGSDKDRVKLDAISLVLWGL